ncbi:MAG TPA: NADH-quinone oxidoreductase subunit L [Alphaproteobacteria bacterium]|nr:NADH-quinone oxidoreductase subunit L [Micavibrio sp.]MBK9563313.1 NADH-quinone oxidoreductase subunit L [Micavibrio sp.]HQX27505.1 NADH-quinone oxidoreductase subunit L [Alphaproteobacteria bacterium]
MEFIAVFAPLIGFIITGIFGTKMGKWPSIVITCGAMFAAAAASIYLFYAVNLQHAPYTTVLANWLTSGELSVNWALRIDQLTVVMMCVINIVSTCVHVYSVGYMSHDDHQIRFMSYLNLFTFAMLMLVTADNLLQLFFGWEGVGLASYLLIGFWHHKHSANAAAQKAFVVNRVGDLTLALGMMGCFAVFGSINFDVIFAEAPKYADTDFVLFGQHLHAMTAICLLLFIGSMGKSAQILLHTWLPDAMEGPTPVSALIHAATMVTAGVFLLARLSPLFEYAPEIRIMITLVGTATAFIAATIGITQFDIKRVIAYSTMSQLGYMFFALGVSAYSAAIFHLMTHAFFKALLFLSAGSVIHAMSDEQDMRKMGGLWKKIPFTYVMMWTGSLALAGIPPFAGFYSKDIVMEAAYAANNWSGQLAFWMSLAAALMTSFYSWRLIIMTFHGKSRSSQDVQDHVHESPSVMLVPLFILAMGAVFSGAFFYEPFVGGEKAAAHNEVSVGHEEQAAHDEPEVVTHEAGGEEGVWSRQSFWGDSILVLDENDSLQAAHHAPKWVKFSPLVAGLLGIFMAYLIYMTGPGVPEKVRHAVPALHALSFNKWYFDEIYDYLFVRRAFGLGRIFTKADRKIIDRFGPDGGAVASGATAKMFSRFQTGFIYQYAFVMMIAVISLLSWFVFRAGQGG